MTIAITNTMTTDAGEVISESMIPLQTPRLPANGSMMAALLKSSPNDVVWCLFYQSGGDWTVFEGGGEYIPEHIDDWMPDAIDAAVKELLSSFGGGDMSDSVAGELSWLKSWAANARRTLGNITPVITD